MEMSVANDKTNELGTMEHDSGKLQTSDGLDLFWQCWSDDIPTGVIVLIHGLAEHSSRYSETARHFAAHGWSVYACDLRGHGLSVDGHRSGRVHVDKFSDYALDVSAILNKTKEQNPNLPRIILGHSMGGLISLSYVLDHPEAFNAAVLSSPLIDTHPDSKPSAVLDVLARFLARVYPRLLFPSRLDTSAVCRDPYVVRAYIDDPLVSDKISAGWYVATTKAIAGIQGRAGDLQVPTLLMQSGADRLVDPNATAQWATNAPPGILEYLTWDGFYHEMLNEPEKDKVRARVLDWLERNT
jgi:alpha-beta hydrolase superfamily lysophospholipase